MRRKEREITDKNELAGILERASVLHLGISDGETPYVVPVSFGIGEHLEALYFHCAGEGKKLDLLRQHPRVCFEADSQLQILTGPAACNWGAAYESVIGYGTVSVLTDPAQKAVALDTLMRHYGFAGKPQYGPDALARTCVCKITVEQLTGKRNSPRE